MRSRASSPCRSGELRRRGRPCNRCTGGMLLGQWGGRRELTPAPPLVFGRGGAPAFRVTARYDSCELQRRQQPPPVGAGGERVRLHALSCLVLQYVMSCSGQGPASGRFSKSTSAIVRPPQRDRRSPGYRQCLPLPLKAFGSGKADGRWREIRGIAHRASELRRGGGWLGSLPAQVLRRPLATMLPIILVSYSGVPFEAETGGGLKKKVQKIPGVSSPHPSVESSMRGPLLQEEPSPSNWEGV